MWRCSVGLSAISIPTSDTREERGLGLGCPALWSLDTTHLIANPYSPLHTARYPLGKSLLKGLYSQFVCPWPWSLESTHLSFRLS